MRLITLSALVLVLSAGTAFAQHHGGRGRSIVRGHGGGGVSVTIRGGGGGYYGGGGRDRRRVDPYRGQVHSDRRVVYRRPMYHNNGSFRFHDGSTVVYRRPVFTQRYYDVNVRPQYVAENYPNQSGYIWVNGSWSWTGYEWSWTAGYYAPDPAYQNYYSDGSYDTYSGDGY